MADTSFAVIAHLVAVDKATRDKVLAKLHEIVEYSRLNEPGILKYGVCLPDNTPPSTTNDETSVYVIEEYLDKAAHDAHMSSEPVKALLDNGAQWFDARTKIYTVRWLPDATLIRPDRLPSQALKTARFDLRDRVENPYVLFATITDLEPADIDHLEPYGAAIVKYATEAEPDTIFYADGRPYDPVGEQVGESQEGTGLPGTFICALEVYASKEACGKHLQDQSVKNLSDEGHKRGSKFVIVPMVMTEGWLIRE